MNPKLLSRMTKVNELVANERLQYQILIGLSFGIAGLALSLYLGDRYIFQRFLGNTDPLITISFIILLSIILLSFFLSQRWFKIYSNTSPKQLLLPFSLAVPLAAGIILVDYKVLFPEDLNILFPESLLFYPAIAYVAEVIFHLLPLSLLIILATSLFKEADHNSTIWLCILIVALLEPVFQTVGFLGKYPSWAVVYVFLHVLAINLIQLGLFKRYDFISMYAFRVVYYILWHIIWGRIRLELLF
jgi:hypothetical protein